MQAWLSLVFVELLASSEAIGYLMVWGRQLLQLDIVIVGMIGGRQVWDKTGFSGRYDFSWECSLTEGVQSTSQTSSALPSGRRCPT